MIVQGDCLDVLRTLEDNSVDALVTDPPAGISFMGKDWDHHKGGRKEWIAWLESVMRECMRVLKPGAHGLVWALPRTAHWTATALEDAGFEIRDCITHLFGSGFPKSLDISKAIDKAAGAEREIVGKKPWSNQDTRGNPISQTGGRVAGSQMDKPRLELSVTAPSTDAAKQWQGFGTALKPAAEFWWLVRKPCSEKTVAANVLKWGTGGLNIDGCRIGTETITQHKRDFSGIHSNKYGPGVKQPVLGLSTTTQGRFPANLVFSHSPRCTEDACDMFECAVKMLDEQSGNRRSAGEYPSESSTTNRIYGERKGRQGALYSDSGGASRFFYCAKVSTSERNAGLNGMPDVQLARSNAAKAGHEHDSNGFNKISTVKNNHPTVKPQKLMRYLCKLVTPPGGTVLDPFMGSGSTGLAAKSEGFQFIGIEREPEYFEIAKARVG